MIDIEFYMKANNIRKRLSDGEFLSEDYVSGQFENFRDENPVVYNIETTNACNMRCKMCPRTTMMTRKVGTLKKDDFIRIAGQLKPFTEEQWGRWEAFVLNTYGIPPDDMSENHFFLYIIPKVIQLHGYGDPLLDKNMDEYVRILSENGLMSYFSCNPANIDIEKTARMFGNGLDYIKYSIESVDDKRHKEIRGEYSDFTGSYKKILQLLDLKAKRNYKTTIVITMLNLNNSWQQDEYEKLRKAFENLDVYIYIKSEDQQWYRKDYHGTESVHWSEICRHPWMSMTIKSNGEAAMCMEDFNNEIILGDATKETLHAIWNGEKYHRFREDHFRLTQGIKCTAQCDMKLVGEYFNK